MDEGEIFLRVPFLPGERQIKDKRQIGLFETIMPFLIVVGTIIFSIYLIVTMVFF